MFSFPEDRRQQIEVYELNLLGQVWSLGQIQQSLFLGLFSLPLPLYPTSKKLF